jgi:phosphatidate cytidylyltransferase
VALPVLLALFFLGPPWLGAGFIAVACILALQEFFALLAARGIRALQGMGLVVMAIVFVETTRPELLPPMLPLALGLVIVAALTRARDLAESVSAAGLTLLGALYVGALGGSMAALLLIPPVAAGPWRLVFLMAVIMTADTTAYFGGRLFGRHKLAPLVSPGKTIEGAVGALLGGIPAALLVRHFGIPDLPLGHAVLLGIAVCVVGIVGDLGESLMKRWAGVKDSGTLFPGHGGMLDRVDSLLLGAPVLYYYFLLTYHGAS